MADNEDERLDWESLDPLVFAGSKLEFLVQVQASTGVGLQKALEILTARYDILRRSHPDAFICSHDEYWKGFYS
jgi:hypothetical protein